MPLPPADTRTSATAQRPEREAEKRESRHTECHHQKREDANSHTTIHTEKGTQSIRFDLVVYAFSTANAANEDELKYKKIPPFVNIVFEEQVAVFRQLILVALPTPAVRVAAALAFTSRPLHLFGGFDDTLPGGALAVCILALASVVFLLRARDHGMYRTPRTEQDAE